MAVAAGRGDDAVVGRVRADGRACRRRSTRRSRVARIGASSVARLVVQRPAARSTEIDPLRQLRQQRRLVAAAGADLEHARRGRRCRARVGAAEQQLDHARDHRRLGDRLAVADRQAGVLVGLGGQRGVDEEMARHGRERRQHARRRDALAAQALDHALRARRPSRGRGRSARVRAPASCAALVQRARCGRSGSRAAAAGAARPRGRSRSSCERKLERGGALAVISRPCSSQSPPAGQRWRGR